MASTRMATPTPSSSPIGKPSSPPWPPPAAAPAYSTRSPASTAAWDACSMPARGDAAVWSARGAKSTSVNAMRPSARDRRVAGRGDAGDAFDGVDRAFDRGSFRSRRRVSGRRGRRTRPARTGVGACAPGVLDWISSLACWDSVPGMRKLPVKSPAKRDRQRGHDAEREQPGGQDGPAAAHRERAETMEKTSHLTLLRIAMLANYKLEFCNHSEGETVMRVFMWVLRILLAAVFLSAGLRKVARRRRDGGHVRRPRRRAVAALRDRRAGDRRRHRTARSRPSPGSRRSG